MSSKRGITINERQRLRAFVAGIQPSLGVDQLRQLEVLERKMGKLIAERRTQNTLDGWLS